MKNKYEILDVIFMYVDLNNFTRFTNSSLNRDMWFETHEKINKELKSRKLIGEHQNIFFSFGIDGFVDSVCLQVETRNLENGEKEVYTNSEGNEFILRRRTYEEAEEDENTDFKFSRDEWKNLKRTKLMDRMLNGTE
jgi:hypothetical protein